MGVLSLPTLAASGSRIAQLDYANMKVTLNGQAVDLRDAYGNEVEPFTINGTTQAQMDEVYAACYGAQPSSPIRYYGGEFIALRGDAVAAINAIDGLSCNKPDGAFYIFVNVRSLGMSSAEVANYLLEEAHIATVPGSAFGPQGEGFIRISYACSYERIVEGMERLKKAVEKPKG